MSIEGQTQVAQRAVFSRNRLDNLLVEVAAGFFAIQRQKRWLQGSLMRYFPRLNEEMWSRNA